MQEEITQQAISLTVEGVRLTAPVLQKAVEKLLGKMKGEVVKGIEALGQHSVKKIVSEGPSANIDLNRQGFGQFRRILRDYGVRYGIRRAVNAFPPKYHIFFRAGSKDAMMAALEEFAALKLNREQRPSVLDKLRSIVKSLQQVMGREQVRDMDRGRER